MIPFPRLHLRHYTNGHYTNGSLDKLCINKLCATCIVQVLETWCDNNDGGERVIRTIYLNLIHKLHWRIPCRYNGYSHDIFDCVAEFSRRAITGPHWFKEEMIRINDNSHSLNDEINFVIVEEEVCVIDKWVPTMFVSSNRRRIITNYEMFVTIFLDDWFDIKVEKYFLKSQRTC